MPARKTATPVEQDVQKLMDGRVLLYRRRDSGKTWHYRIWVGDAKKYVRRSTKTPNLNEAREIATEAFYEIRVKVKDGLPIFQKTFKEVWDMCQDDEDRKVTRGELTQSRRDDLKRKALIYYLPFFGKRQITSITQAVIHQYWEWRMDFWKRPESEMIRKKYKIMRTATEPKGSTLHIEKRVLDMVLDKALALNYIRSKPDTTPPAKNDKERRPALTMEQWKKMRDFMCDVYRFEKDRMNPRKYRARNLLYYYCFTMVSTGMRVSDLRNVTWKDITLFKDNAGNVSTMLQVHGKKNVRDVIAYPQLYSLLQEWRENEYCWFIEDTDFVFANWDGKPLRDQGEAFDNMKVAAEKTEDYSGISEDYVGDKITVYSLRHTYATFAIMYHGTTYDDLSKNMGNSPKVLKMHYDKVKSTDIAKRLNQAPANLMKATPSKIREVRRKEFDLGVYGQQAEKKKKETELLVSLLDGEITQAKYEKEKKALQ